MEPSTTLFFNYFNDKYSNRPYVKYEPKTFTKSELQTMNYGSLWRGCIVLPKSNISYTLEPTCEIDGSMERKYKAVKHSTSSS
jgi:hypothetical protein